MSEERLAAEAATVVIHRQAPHPIQWVIAGALMVIAVALVLRIDGESGSAAFAQSVTSGGGHGVFAFTGQLTKETYGLYMVDLDKMTLWAYELVPKKGLRLAASRTWRYDRYLEDYNTFDLSPESVEKMVEDQRKYRMMKLDGDNEP